MNSEIKIINENEYNSFSKYPILFQDKEIFNRFYGLFMAKNIGYRIAWYSDIVNPVINEWDDDIYSIGIDQNFAIIDFKKTEVLLNLKLSYNFYTIKNIKERIFIITELEIIELNKEDFQIKFHYELPEIFEEIIVDGNFIEVLCFGDLKIRI